MRPSLPAGVRYVITLDADTRTADRRRQAAGRQDGASAQPAALRSAARPASMQGHGILQPRVTPSLPIGREGSLFQRVFSGPNGLDPYAFAVSDVYQDLFEEGSYCGKGIYDVDVFEAALKGQNPRKHGPQPRSAGRNIRARRPGLGHRGGRGISVALRRGGGAPASLGARRLAVAALDFRASAANCATARDERFIPLMGRWKMLDNLRRSLSAPAALLALLIAWLLPLRRPRSSGPPSSC